jgi:tRNA 2-thiouridine synthesizing protein C
VSSTTRRSILVLARHAPYGSGLARAGIDLALAAAAFDQPVTLLFCDEGVLQLVDGQAPAAGSRTLGKLLASLPLYDIERVYADQDALQRYGLDAATLVLPVEPVDVAAQQALLASHDHLLSF